jgi:hypothetical protein
MSNPEVPDVVGDARFSCEGQPRGLGILIHVNVRIRVAGPNFGAAADLLRMFHKLSKLGLKELFESAPKGAIRCSDSHPAHTRNAGLAAGWAACLLALLS